MTDDPEIWASILGWQCWRDAAGTWHARQAGALPAILRAASLDALRVMIDKSNRRSTRREDTASDK